MGQENATQHTIDDFHQLKLLFTDPLQHDYEVIRPIVLFAETVASRSAQTNIERSTLGEKARRFVQRGMLGLADQRATHSGRKPHTFPEPIATYILYLKQLYPPIHYREIVRILAAADEVRERRDQVRRPTYTKPELLATQPRELWSWDITKLKGPAKWTVLLSVCHCGRVQPLRGRLDDQRARDGRTG